MKKNRIISVVLVLTLMFTMLITPSTVSAASKIHISKAKISLSYTTCIYDGKAKKPAVTVKYGTKKLINGKDYTVAYSKNVNVGKAVAIIKGKGRFSGSSSKEYIIKPKGTICTCVIGQIEIGGPQVHVVWKEQKTQTTGYSIELLNTKTNRITGYATGTNTQTEMNIKANKNTCYRVRIRTYRMVNGKAYFSNYSDWYCCRTLI